MNVVNRLINLPFGDGLYNPLKHGDDLGMFFCLPHWLFLNGRFRKNDDLMGDMIGHISWDLYTVISYGYIWLVVDLPFLENMSSSVGVTVPSRWTHKFMFQTTNQI